MSNGRERPSPSGPPGPPSRDRRRRRAGSTPAALRRALPVLFGLVVVAALSWVSLVVGGRSLRAAEGDRLSARASLVGASVARVATIQENRSVAHLLEITPPSRMDPAAAEALLKRLRTAALGSRSDAVLLVSTDGEVLAASPEGAGVDVDDLGTAWEAARAGRPGTSDVFRDGTTAADAGGGAVSWASLLPVGGAEPWAVLVQVRHAVADAEQTIEAALGAMDGRPGGLVHVDRAGTVVHSWDGGELGRPFLSPERMGQLTTAGTTQWTETRDGRETTFIGGLVPSGHAVVFEQATDDLMGDLREAQQRRDLTLLGVMAGLTVGLVVFQLNRERAVRRAARRLHVLLEHSTDLILVCAADGRLRFASPTIHTLLGHDPCDWIGRPATELVGSDGETLARLIGDPSSGTLLDVQLRTASGETRWFDVEASPLPDGRHAGVLLTCHDAEPRRAARSVMHQQATHDELTGLPNRAALAERFASLAQAPPERFAFLYLDLDGFKPVNDRRGHEGGDQLLVTIAARFTDAIGGGFVCRLGGDEFGFLLEGADKHAAIAVADRLLTAVRAPVTIGPHLARVDASIGIAVADTDHEPTAPDEILRRADQAMYQAKTTGRGRYSVFTGLPTGDAAGFPTAPPAREPTGAGTGGHPPTPPEGGPVHAVPAPSTAPRRPVRRRRSAGAAPVAVAAAVLVAIATVGQALTAQAQREAETRHENEMHQLLPRVAAGFSRDFTPNALTGIISSLPWSLDGSPGDQALTDVVATSPLNGPGTVAGLATLGGRWLATAPAGVPLKVGPASPAWAVARQGSVATITNVADDDESRLYFLVPIVRAGRPAAIQVLGMSHRTSAVAEISRASRQLGGTARLVTVGHDGAAFFAPDRDMNGRQIADPAELAALAPGETADVSLGPDQVVIASPLAAYSGPHPAYFVFTQPAADFYGGLRAGQTARNLGLLAVIVVGVAGLTAVNARRERDARRDEERLDTLLHQAHDIIAVVDGEGRVSFASSATAGLLGTDPGAWQKQAFLALTHPDDRERVEPALVGAAAPRGPSSLADVRLAHADGTFRWFDLDIAARGDHRDVGGTVLTCHEVSLRKALHDQQAYLATHDTLTGLANRVAFAEHLERVSALSSAGAPTPFAVLYLDLDHFKPVNDTYGHDAGDLVLRQVATRLAGSVRSADTATNAVCRLGGDEFAVLLPGATEADALAVARRILAAVRQPIDIGVATVTVDATIGIAVSDSGTDHAATAVRNADAAMYRAKAAGRGGYLVFTAG